MSVDCLVGGWWWSVGWSDGGRLVCAIFSDCDRSYSLAIDPSRSIFTRSSLVLDWPTTRPTIFFFLFIVDLTTDWLSSSYFIVNRRPTSATSIVYDTTGSAQHPPYIPLRKISWKGTKSMSTVSMGMILVCPIATMILVRPIATLLLAHSKAMEAKGLGSMWSIIDVYLS